MHSTALDFYFHMVMLCCGKKKLYFIHGRKCVKIRGRDDLASSKWLHLFAANESEESLCAEGGKKKSSVEIC